MVFSVAAESVLQSDLNISHAGSSAPVHLGSITNGTGGALLHYAGDVCVSGNYAYVVSGYDRGASDNGPQALQIVDITNPPAPVAKGKYMNGEGGACLEGPVSIAISGTYAYIAGYYGSVEIVDISNPMAPVHKSSITTGKDGYPLDYLTSIAVSGHYAYVTSTWTSDLQIFDISNPAAPVYTGWFRYTSGIDKMVEPVSVVISGKYAFVADYYAVEIVDISNPASPVLKSRIRNSDGSTILDAGGVFVSGKYAYVTSKYSDSLEIFDVSTPAAPVHKGTIKNGSGGVLLDNPERLFVSGDYAYVASWNNNALEIIDISNPAAPVHAGSLTDGTDGALLKGPAGIAVSGDNVYVASYYRSALEIVRFTVSPTIQNIAPTSGYSSGTCAAVITGTNFHTGVSVKLVKGSATIAGSVLSNTVARITCTLPLSGATAGTWNLTVTNADRTSVTKRKAFTVKPAGPKPVITAISPSSGYASGNITAIITGTNFRSGITVKLVKGTIVRVATVKKVTSSRITCSLPLSGASAGTYTLIVTNKDGTSATKLQAFIVKAEGPKPTFFSITPDSAGQGRTPG